VLLPRRRFERAVKKWLHKAAPRDPKDQGAP
jgi:hypothetical protein